MNYGDYGFFGVPPVDLGTLDDPKRSKKIFSRAYFALFTYLVATYAALFICEIVMLLALGKEKYADIMTSPIYSLLVSSGCQYLVGFPVFLLLSRKKETCEKKEAKKMPLSHFLYSLLACQTLLVAGNLVGLMLNGIVAGFTGAAPENTVDTLVAETPIWLLFILVVIVAPIVEELIFRKIMIERLAVFGDKCAIIVSAVAFGFFHGNLYQIFYALLIGLVFGYVYTRTRRVGYTIVLHAIINLFGSVVSIYMTRIAERINEIIELSKEGAAVNAVEYTILVTLQLGYSLLFSAASMLGAVIIVMFIYKKGLSTVSSKREIFVPRGKLFDYSLLNTGAILFYVTSCLLILAELIVPALT